MNENLILSENHDFFVTLTLNREDKKNALNIAMMQQLSKLIKEWENKTKVIIIKGAGNIFCAGMDLIEASDLKLEEALSKEIANVLHTIYECKIPIIAAVHGAAIAGGFGLVLACDLVVAEMGTVFSLPEVKRGLVAAHIMPYLFRKLPKNILREALFLGRPIEPSKLESLGVINRLTPFHDHLKEARELASEVANGAPHAIALTKNLIKKFEETFLFDDCKSVYHEARSGVEFQEGLKAFLEKRTPNWN